MDDFLSAGVPPPGLPTAQHLGVTSSLEGEHEKKDGYGYDDEHMVTVGHASGQDYEGQPTEEELLTLRKVAAPMPWAAVAMCLIEFAERASYYGSTGPFNNFINNPLPAGGSGTGAVPKGPAGLNAHAGALGLGSRDASALTNMFTFLAYVIPIFGGIIADTKWGRFKTICVGTAVGAIAHVLLIIPALPSVIKHPDGSLGAFTISIIILAFAAGFIKPSLGPLLCDQSPVKEPTIKVLKSGERVIVDPGATVTRYLLIFYGCINIGAFFAVATEYAERDVGFWLAYLLPGILYMLMPIVLVLAYRNLYKAPPQGSVALEAWKVMKVLFKNGGWKKAFRGGDDFWVKAKPSYIAATEGSLDVTKVFWDDRFVDEIRQSFNACAIFFIIPIFNLADGGFGNQMNDMSDTMVLNGVPNDLVANFNSLTIIVCTPILTYGLYPMMTKIGLPLKPMTRMCIGFILGSIGCIVAAVVQHNIYKTSPCGNQATQCAEPSTVSLWMQVPIYVFPALGELFVNVTSYELAYTRSPARMKGLVYSLALFPTALSTAVSLAVTDAIVDPYLVWPWVAIAIVSFLCAPIFPIFFRHLDVPLEHFSDPDRQAGLQQPNVIMGGESGTQVVEKAH
ncbi:hypothetical protein IAR55_000655 [Kwoniella newhampshirensis]|uniref:POT family proton-dependent oligopeptide transporter n=1 Tax=Kwoniella newhampshirensis TaxID=1651941 RepID=A0AAW0Z7F6_9TREE